LINGGYGRRKTIYYARTELKEKTILEFSQLICLELNLALICKELNRRNTKEFMRNMLFSEFQEMSTIGLGFENNIFGSLRYLLLMISR
jgi:hypothetical protein